MLFDVKSERYYMGFPMVFRKFYRTRRIAHFRANASVKTLQIIVINAVISIKGPPTSFSPVTSTNVAISPQNFLTFNFKNL